MRRLPPLKALRAFDATARHESLTEAARELNVSHSAISQHVKNLEFYFGQPLFERRGRAIRLTPRARAYFEDVRACFDRIAFASDQLSASTRAPILRINATPTFAMRWLIPRLPRFQIAHPLTEVRIATSPVDTIDQLEDAYDVIIRRNKIERSGYQGRRFLQDNATAVLAPRLAETVSLKNPEDIQQLPLLHMRSRANAWAMWLRAASIPIQETIPGPFFDHFFLSLEAAINGIGVALAPKTLIEDDLEQGRLIEPFDKVLVEGEGFYCLYRENGQQDRNLNPLLNWLFDEGGLA